MLDHLITGNDEGIVTPEQLATGREQVGKAVALLNGYMKYLKRAIEAAPKKPNNQNPLSLGRVVGAVTYFLHTGSVKCAKIGFKQSETPCTPLQSRKQVLPWKK